MTVICLCLGGSPESMKKRIAALKNIEADQFVFSGFESEISFMKSQIGEKENVGYALSYDTLSNFESCLSTLKNADKILLATSPLHWRRVELIVSRKIPQIKEKIEWIDSYEEEASYAALGLLIYKIFGPELLQKVSIVMRWRKFKREYCIPLWREIPD